MSYSTGMMHYRIAIQRRSQSAGDTFGRGSGGYTWETVGTLWASYSFSRGVKSLREGAVDAYDTVMFRFRPCLKVTREDRIECNGKIYAIRSLHEDYQANTVQVTAVELVNP